MLGFFYFVKLSFPAANSFLQTSPQVDLSRRVPPFDLLRGAHIKNHYIMDLTVPEAVMQGESSMKDKVTSKSKSAKMCILYSHEFHLSPLLK